MSHRLLKSRNLVTSSVTDYPVVTGNTNDPDGPSDTSVDSDSTVTMCPVSLLTPISPVTPVSPCPQMTPVFPVTSMFPYPCRYLESRGLLEGHGPPQVPSLPSPAERDVAYMGWALEGWPGRSGHDAPMVALEALLAAGGSWGDLCARGVLHGGDNDSTGTIAAGCWGLRWGLASVPPGLHSCLEHRKRLHNAAHRLHALAWGRH